MKKPIIYTVGHSTSEIDKFLDLLKAHGVKAVADVRTIPKSRHNPQFNQEELKQSLKEAKIAYRHIKKLGGLRHARKDSVNLGWKNTSFRGYADYMNTDDFASGLEQLKTMANKKVTAIMCAEAVPWRCHRSLIADALTKQKWAVFHIQSRKTANRHKLTPFLKIRSGKIVYPFNSGG